MLREKKRIFRPWYGLLKVRVNESFAGYNSLGLHPWSLSGCSTSIQDLLDFMVSIGMLGVILIGLSLYIT